MRRHGIPFRILVMLSKVLSLCSKSKAGGPPPEVPAVSDSPAGVPPFVLKHAPLVYLHTQEKYFPSDILAQVTHSVPKLKLEPIADAPQNLTLADLDKLNEYGPDVCLTTKDDITKDPAWIKGAQPDDTGKAKDGAVPCAVIVVDKGSGRTDAFYFYFYAYNWGGKVLDKNLGNHVGDWEHNMIRFENGEPKIIYYSQHSTGQTFKWDAVQKDKSGFRPVNYSANGSHANYADTGLHNHDNPHLVLKTPGITNDYTDRGKLWDPAKSAYWYKWTPPAANASSGPSSGGDSAAPLRNTTKLGTFEPYDANTSPLGYLYFEGRWGDWQYPENDPRQQVLEILFLFKFYKYNTGPDGPAFKKLGRKDPWQADKGRVLDDID